VHVVVVVVLPVPPQRGVVVCSPFVVVVVVSLEKVHVTLGVTVLELHLIHQTI
jgi:hypothetical protein